MQYQWTNWKSILWLARERSVEMRIVSQPPIRSTVPLAQSMSMMSMMLMIRYVMLHWIEVSQYHCCCGGGGGGSQ